MRNRVACVSARRQRRRQLYIYVYVKKKNRAAPNALDERRRLAIIESCFPSEGAKNIKSSPIVCHICIYKAVAARTRKHHGCFNIIIIRRTAIQHF